MKTIILLLSLTPSLFAADGAVTWTTFVRPFSCPGGVHYGSNSPITLLSAQDLPETYYMSTNYLIGLVRTPRSIVANDYTSVSSGSITSTNEESSVRWVWIEHLLYAGNCCDHPQAWTGLEVKDVATYSGGLIGTNQIVTTTQFIDVGGWSQGSDAIVINVQHLVDDGSRRETVFDIWPGAPRMCPSKDARLHQMLFRSGTNRTLRVRGTTNQANQTVTILTNAVLNTNWIFATPVTLDSNAEADVDVTNWLMPDSQGYFRVDYTNGP